MRDGWREVEVREVAALNPEGIQKTEPPPEFLYVDIASVSSAGIDPSAVKTVKAADAPSRAQRVIREGDVIVSTVRPYLRARALIAREFHGVIASTGFCVLRPSPAVVPGYLDAVTSTDEFYAHLAARQTGTAYPAVRPVDLGDAKVPLPPLQEQRRIADLLGALDHTVRARREEVWGLRELLGALGDDLVRRAATNGFTRLGDAAVVERGYTWKKRDESPKPERGAVPVVRIGNVQRDGIDMADRLWIRNVDPAKVAKKLITEGTILLVGSNGNPERVGNAYLVDSSTEGHLFASFLMGVTPTSLPARFVWRYLQSPTLQRAMTEAASGSTGLMNIGLTWMRDLEIPSPTPEECEALLGPLEAVDLKRLRAVEALKATERLRAALVSSLLSGQHEIPASYDRLLDENSDEIALEPVAV